MPLAGLVLERVLCSEAMSHLHSTSTGIVVYRPHAERVESAVFGLAGIVLDIVLHYSTSDETVDSGVHRLISATYIHTRA